MSRREAGGRNLRGAGVLLLLAALYCGAAYWEMDPTVPVPKETAPFGDSVGGGRVYNLGRGLERQNWFTLAVNLGLAAVVCFVAGSVLVYTEPDPTPVSWSACGIKLLLLVLAGVVLVVFLGFCLVAAEVCSLKGMPTPRGRGAPDGATTPGRPRPGRVADTRAGQ
jgi:hypothetical protein